jgi:TonB-linked SusC/RagA family outer membrane protein
MKKILLTFLLLSIITLGSVYAQSRKITGRVIGADDGQPLPGVSVSIKGTTRGVITTGEGRFTLTASPGETLQVTFIGYTSQSIPVTGATDYQVKLATDTKLLNEVVVLDGYGAQQKKAFTGSSSTVNGAQNENKPFSSPLQALQGEIPGLNISSNSGQPGANVQVRLRGVGSISAGSNPLYVIDGQIVNAGDVSRLTTTTNILAGLNEDDIASITVLKDASATAIYGSRGSNGVIVITTKRGRSGKTQIRFDAEAGVTSNLPIPAGGKPATAAEYATLFTEGLTNGGSSAATIAALQTSYGINAASNDWYKLVTRQGQQQQYNVSASGGGESTKVFASGGYFKQQATTIGSDLQRITALVNVDHNISKRFSFSLSANVSNIAQNTPSNGGAFASPVLASYFLRPFQLAKNPDGSLNSSTVGNTNFSSIYNPLYMVAHDKKFDSETHVLTSGSVKWNIWDQLNFTSYASMDYLSLEESQFNNPIMGDGKSAGGRGFDYYSRYANTLLRQQLDYRYNIPKVEDFYIDVNVGYESQKSAGYLLAAQSNGYPLTQPLLTASANAATPIVGNGSFTNYTFDSFFSRATINFKNKYALNGTFRRDGSSLFGANFPYGNFYSIGGAWNVDQEDFFKVQKVLSSAKFRASFGKTGNAQFSNTNTTNSVYLAQPTAGYGSNYAGSVGQAFNTIGNPNLTWESQNKLDIGANFGFFNDRLVFDADYYHNDINKLIQNVPITRTTGFSTVTANIGAMVNKGFEFAVTGVPIKSRDFSWTTNFNIAFNQNKVTQLFNNAPFINGSFHAEVGKDLYTWYTRQYAGVDPANGNSLWYTDVTRTATTSNYAAAARIDEKQADPKYFGGFSNTFNYKGIILTADFYYNFGNYINDSWAFYLTDGTNLTFNKYEYDYQRRWTTPGQITDVPKYVNGGTNAGQSSSFSDRFLYRGDYIRLKNLTVGYDLKNLDLIKSWGISKLYIYGRGTNLWTKTYDKKLPFDPEVGITGTSNLEVPQARTFTIGLNVGL